MKYEYYKRIIRDKDGLIQYRGFLTKGMYTNILTILQILLIQL